MTLNFLRPSTRLSAINGRKWGRYRADGKSCGELG